MSGVPLRSEIFDDIYFSADDPLGESHHVFLDGTGLAAFFASGGAVRVGETGFGTGLNFLMAEALAERIRCENPDSNVFLEYFSVEKYPLPRDKIAETLRPLMHSPAFSGWRLSGILESCLDHYPATPSEGIYTWTMPSGGCMRLLCADVAVALAQETLPADAWFLDGFAPARNPEMWTQNVFAHIARLSRTGTRLASFTAAGAVRRGLSEAGFQMQKKTGFGRKRHMLTGIFGGDSSAHAPNPPIDYIQ